MVILRLLILQYIGHWMVEVLFVITPYRVLEGCRFYLLLRPTEYWRVTDLLLVHLRVLEVGTRVTVVGTLWVFCKNDFSVIFLKKI